MSFVTLISGTIASVGTALAAYFFAESAAVLYGLLIGLVGITLTLVLEQRVKATDFERLLTEVSHEAHVAAEIDRLSKVDEIFAIKYSELKTEMEDLARGVYQIRTLTSLYQDDIRSIGMLRDGDVLLSTCPVTPASEAEALRQISSPAYKESIGAHIAAQKRGVKVTRIYLLRDLKAFNFPQINEHLLQLEAAGLDVRVILRDQVILDSQFDFLVFGGSKVSVGVAEPGAGTVSGAIVYTESSVVRRYTGEYGKLRVMSASPSEILNRNQSPSQRRPGQ